MSKKLTEDQIRDTAKDANIPYHHLRAVIEVESRGDGFLPSGSPVILFERHIFYKESGLYPVSQYAPDVSNKKPGGYLGGLREWGRLYKAFGIMMELGASYGEATHAIYRSCSWGLGQIMGYNYQLAGFDSVGGMVYAMKQSERRQLEAMVTFIKSNEKMYKALQEGDWATFARLYNGPGYRKNNYDVRLQKSAEKWENKQ